MKPPELNKYLRIDIFPIKYGNSFMICNAEMKLINNKPFDYISPFENGFGIYGTKQNNEGKFLYGLLSESGEVFLKAEYHRIDRIHPTSDRVILMAKRNLYHLYDTKMKTILFTSVQLHRSIHGFDFLVFNKGSIYSNEGEAGGFTETNYDGESYGLIDLNGNILVPPEFNLIDYPKEGILRVNHYGALYNDFEFNFLENEFHFGCTSKIVIGGIFYYINLKTNIPLPNTYKFCWNFNNGIARVLLDGELEIFESENRKHVRIKNPIYGYINKYGEILYKTEINCSAFDFVNGKAKIKTSKDKIIFLEIENGKLIEKYNIIERKNTKVIDGFILYKSNIGMQIFDMKICKELLRIDKNFSIEYISNNIFHKIIKKNNLSFDLEILEYKSSGHLTEIGNILNIESFYISNGILFVSASGKAGAFLIDGSEIIPLQYDKIKFESGLLAVYKKIDEFRDFLLGYYSILGIKYF